MFKDMFKDFKGMFSCFSSKTTVTINGKVLSEEDTEKLSGKINKAFGSVEKVFDDMNVVFDEFDGVFYEAKKMEDEKEGGKNEKCKKDSS